MNKIDLHMHSNYSNDGSFSPTELMSQCAEASLELVALSDHNSVRGLKEAKAAASRHGIAFLNAIELDCFHGATHLHVLGYGINPDNPLYWSIEQTIAAQEKQASARRLKLLQELGLQFDEQQLQTLAVDGVMTGELLAEVALADKRNEHHPLLKPYRDSANPYVEFYWDFCAPDKQAYVPIEYMSLAEAVTLIHNDGGLAVLAHPGANIKEDAALLTSIINENIDGLEAFSSYHSPAQALFYATEANRFHLLTTCGSDFHGKTKPSITLGSASLPDNHAALVRALSIYL